MQFSNMSLIPRPVPSEISRSHLLSLFLSQNLRVIALLAPSGYGKTTLLAQFARLNPSSFWLSLSDDSQDLLFFAHSLRDALSPLELPTFGAYLSESPSPSPSSLGRAFLQDLAFLPPITVCIDQIQHLGAASAAFLNVVFGEMREPNRVLLSGYAPEALKLAELLSKNAGLVLGPEELKFTESEVEEYLGRKKSKMGVGELGFLEGWPAGLSLQTSVSSMYADPQRLIGELLSDLLVEYPEMPKLSVLSVWSEEEVEGFGLEMREGWLEEMWSRGHLLLPLGQHKYRPHRLLRLFLEGLLKQHKTSHRDAHRQAGMLLERNGKPLEALKHYKQAEDKERIFQLVRSVTPRYLGRMEDQVLCAMFDGLDIQTLPVDLLEIYAVARIYGDGQKITDEKVQLLEKAYEKGGRSRYLVKMLSDVEYDRGQISKAIGWIDRGLGEPTLKDNLALLRTKIMHLYASENTPARKGLIEYTLKLGEQDDHPVQNAVTWTICGEAYVYGGEYEKGLRYGQKASKIFWKLRNISYYVLAQKVVLGAWMGKGEWEQAEFVAAHLKEMVWPLIRDGELMVDLGFLASFFLLHNRVEEALTLCRVLGDEISRKVHWAVGLAKAREFEIWVGMGREEEAGMVYEELKRMPRYGLEREWGSADVHIGIGLYGMGKEEEGRRYIKRGMGYVVHEYEKYRGRLYLGEVEEERELELPRVVEFDKHIIGKQKRYISEIEKTKALQQIEIYTFGKTKIKYGHLEKVLSNKRAGEILVFLAIHGEASREQIIDAVWDGFYTPQIAAHFRVLIRRLRHELRSWGLNVDPIPYERGLYRLSPQVSFWLDVVDLETLNRLPEFDRSWLKAWQGDWMPNASSGWFEYKRAEVYQRLYQACVFWGVQLEHMDVDSAVAMLRKAVQLDALDERAYVALIQLLMRSGRLQEARNIYKDMQTTWLRELGMRPEFTFPGMP